MGKGSGVRPGDIEGRLRGAGLRVTAPRVAVLSVLAEAQDHPRVDQVIERVRAGGLSTFWGMCPTCQVKGEAA